MNVMNLSKSSFDRQEQPAPVRIDIDRMNSALSAERFTLPQGLSAEEIRKHIIAKARGK